jgi:hypothetical protein
MSGSHEVDEHLHTSGSKVVCKRLSEEKRKKKKAEACPRRKKVRDGAAPAGHYF